MSSKNLIKATQLFFLTKKYLEGLSKLLNNITKFELLQFDHDKEMNCILNLKKKIINFLTDLNNKEKITDVDYNHL